jgi:hypothetical protein
MWLVHGAFEEVHVFQSRVELQAALPQHINGCNRHAAFMKFRLQPLIGDEKLPDAGIGITGTDRQEVSLGLIGGQTLPVASHAPPALPGNVELFKVGLAGFPENQIPEQFFERGGIEPELQRFLRLLGVVGHSAGLISQARLQVRRSISIPLKLSKVISLKSSA